MVVKVFKSFLLLSIFCQSSFAAWGPIISGGGHAYSKDLCEAAYGDTLYSCKSISSADFAMDATYMACCRLFELQGGVPLGDPVNP